MELSADQIRHLRLRSQGLLRDPDTVRGSPATVLRRALAVQAQDAGATVLSIWARSDRLTARDIERARVKEQSVVRTWLMRGTLHLAAAEDLGWLLPVLGPRFIRTGRRRCEELGLDESVRRESLQAIEEILSKRSPMTRTALTERLADRGFPTEGQAAYHLLHHAGLNGLLCYGPDKEGEETFVLLDEWAEIGAALPEDEARAELARRYLNAYAPAGPKDLSGWSGLTLTQSRAAFRAIADELVEIEFGGAPLWLLSGQEAWLDDEPTGASHVRLLPRYDTYLLGYRNRDLVVPDAFSKRVHPGGGILHPVVLIDGVAAATWKMKRNRGHIEVMVDPFESFEDDVTDRLKDEVQDLGRFLEVSAHLTVLSG
ncbi:MAG: winged helix DNA-binding domain-containing protein [Anaerolineae bacterium]